jgi:hypothetical protein
MARKLFFIRKLPGKLWPSKVVTSNGHNFPEFPGKKLIFGHFREDPKSGHSPFSREFLGKK